MNERMWLYAGVAAALGALSLLVLYDPIGAVSIGPAPPQPPVTGGAWQALDTDVLMLTPGVRYRGCVKLGLVSPLKLLSADRVASELAAQGFTAVRVLTGDPPPNWPNQVCYWYVDATYSGAAKTIARPSVVTFAWQWVPAVTT